MSLAAVGVGGAALIGAAGTVGGALISANASKDAAGVAGNAPQVNIAQLQSQAQTIAQQNAAASQALQNQYTPWITSGQSASNYGVQSQLTPNAGTTASMNYLQGQIGQPLNSSLLNSAASTAQQQLNLGGTLGQDTQNSVTRNALATAGGVTPGGLGQGANITAADLGLTSLQLQNQRLQNASSIGQQQYGVSQGNAANSLQSIAGLSNLNQTQFQNNLNAAGMYNNIQAPTSGLNPGSLGGLAVGNTNAQSAANASQANIIGQEGQNLSKSVGGLAGYLGQYASANTGAQQTYNPQLTYAQFLQQNPGSSAAIGS
jgi:hypothetical protein